MKLDEVRPGDVLVADNGFTCLPTAEHCEVKRDSSICGSGLFVDCAEGKHFLDGQLDADGHVVGFAKVDG